MEVRTCRVACRAGIPYCLPRRYVLPFIHVDLREVRVECREAVGVLQKDPFAVGIAAVYGIGVTGRGYGA